MNSIKPFRNRLVGILGVCMGVLALVIAPFNGAVAKGVLAGSIASILFLEVLSRKIQKVALQPHLVAKKTFTLFFLTYIIMYFLIGILLWAAIQKGVPFFIGCVIGLMAVKIAIMAERWVFHGRT